MNRLFQTLTVFLLPGATSLSAFTHSASSTRNSSNTGLTPAHAFPTLPKEADTAAVGITVIAANGTYAGFNYRNKKDQ